MRRIHGDRLTASVIAWGLEPCNVASYGRMTWKTSYNSVNNKPQWFADDNPDKDTQLIMGQSCTQESCTGFESRWPFGHLHTSNYRAIQALPDAHDSMYNYHTFASHQQNHDFLSPTPHGSEDKNKAVDADTRRQTLRSEGNVAWITSRRPT